MWLLLKERKQWDYNSIYELPTVGFSTSTVDGCEIHYL